MSTSDRPDVLVIGGGPGGYATALRCVAHGLSVVVVEAEHVGGTCLHRGCVPSKALLHLAAARDEQHRLASFGFPAAEQDVDVAAVGRFRDDVVSRLHRGLGGLLKARGVDVVPARARLVGPGAVQLDDGSRRTAAHVVLATGSVPQAVPGLPVDGEVVITSDHALQVERIPTTALVVGGGAVGMEFASFWRSMGTDVTIVEALDRLLPLEDESSSAFVTRAFERRGIDVRTGVRVESVSVTAGRALVALTDGSSVDADQVLVAAGRAPNTSSLGAEEMGLLDDRGFVKVDSHCRTSLDGVWAVGDVIRTLALAHAAFEEGFLVADAIAGRSPAAIVYENVPRVTYSRPEVASVGLTEAQARAQRDDVVVTVESMAGNARAIVDGEDGQVKVVAAGDGELLGVHVVGPTATELVAEAALATAWGALAVEAAGVVHAHPTFGEGLRETFLSAAGLPFHVHGKKRVAGV